jgi:hypothetical protein
MVPAVVSITACLSFISAGVSGVVNRAATGAAVRVRGLLRDLLGHLESLDHAGEHRVLAVEDRLVDQADEELRAGAVRLVGAEGRRDSALRVLLAAVLRAQDAETAAAVLGAFCRVLGQGIPALDDAVLDQPVERRPVVGAGAGPLDEVAHVVRGGLWQQLQDDLAEVRGDDGLLALHRVERERRRVERRGCRLSRARRVDGLLRRLRGGGTRGHRQSGPDRHEGRASGSRGH